MHWAEELTTYRPHLSRKLYSPYKQVLGRKAMQPLATLHHALIDCCIVDIPWPFGSNACCSACCGGSLVCAESLPFERRNLYGASNEFVELTRSMWTRATQRACTWRVYIPG